MAKILNKYFWFIIPALYAFTRLVNLRAIPIFTDEAIYSYWAQVALHDPENRYISLEDGKQPLFIWIGAAIQKIITDPLIAIRLTSVFSGALAVFAIYLLAKELFGKKVARLSALLYVILPFTLLYDRMGLYDSLLTMLGIFSAYFALRMAKTPRLDLALLNGMTIGLGLLTKSSAFIYFLFIPICLLAFDFKNSFKPKLAKWGLFSLITFVIAQVMYNSLRLSPLFYRVAEKNREFIRPLNQVIKSPFEHFYSNVSTIISWLGSYLTWPVLLLFAVATIYFLFKKNLKVAVLSIFIIIPILAEGLFNKVLYPRFVLFYFPYIIILLSLAAVSLSEFKSKYSKYIKIALPLIFIYPALNSVLLTTMPVSASIAQSDSNQYLNDWPAGFGVKEAIQIIKSQEGSGPVYVATEGTFGLLPYALQVYFYADHRVQIQGFYPLDPQKLPQQIDNALLGNEVFLILNENQKEVINPQLKLVGSYQKGNGKSFLRIFEVSPQ